MSSKRFKFTFHRTNETIDIYAIDTAYTDTLFFLFSYDYWFKHCWILNNWKFILKYLKNERDE